MAKATEETLGELHGLVADYLIKQMRSGEEISPQMINQAIKLLKDNGIEATPGDSKMDDLAKEIESLDLYEYGT